MIFARIFCSHKNPVRVTAPAVREAGLFVAAFSCFFHFLIFRITKKFFRSGTVAPNERAMGCTTPPKKPCFQPSNFGVRSWQSTR
jgi:hypothetical protein